MLRFYELLWRRNQPKFLVFQSSHLLKYFCLEDLTDGKSEIALATFTGRSDSMISIPCLTSLWYACNLSASVSRRSWDGADPIMIITPLLCSLSYNSCFCSSIRGPT